jgi:signal transduction histidine kinase
VQEVGELYEPLAEIRSIKFIMHVESMPAIHADRNLLVEPRSNLVDSAIKRTQEGGAVTMELKMTLAGPQVSISDTGPGIPVAERELVLQRFYRSQTTQHLPGSGIGLSIVSVVLRVHDLTMRMSRGEPGVRVIIDCWLRMLG